MFPDKCKSCLMWDIPDKMPRPSLLNHSQKLDIIEKVNHGWKASGILRHLKEQGYCLSLSSVKTIIRKYKTGNFENIECVSESKTSFKKITYGHVVLIQQILENDPLQSSQDIQTQLDCGISRTTVLTAIRYAGWTSAKPRYCSMVRAANQLKRATFCEELITDNEKFSDCIFSDECTIQLQDNKLSCFRRIDGAAANVPTPKHPLKVHLWGAISRRGRSPLLIFDGIMEKVFYTNSILDSVLVPFIQKTFPDSHRFVQDNDPKHTSNYAKEFMATNDINWWKWPAVPNGTVKETVQDEEFDKYIQHQQAGYNAAPMSSPGVSDPFVNYYNPSMSFPYLGQGLGEGAWSNGGDATVFSMGNYDYNGMFGGFGYPQFAWDYQASEYWNNATPGRSEKREYEDYYRGMIPADGYGAMNGEVDRTAGISSVEQGFKGMSLVGEKVDGTVSDVIPGDSAGVPLNAGVHGHGHGHGHAPQKTSWAAIASQPARPQTQMRPRPPRAPMNPNKQNLDIGTWDNKNNANRQGSQQGRTWSAPRRTVASYNSPQGNSNNSSSGSPPGTSANSGGNASNHPVLEKLKSSNQYNPKEYNLNPKGARFFIIKSYSEDDIHRSIKYNIWCSTDHGNKRLDAAYRERESKGPIYLLFSVNGSGHFCGMAQMMTKVDYGKNSGVWAQDKWKGQIEVKWVYVKDVPNSQLRHIRLENNENKPVTNSRDTQEVPPEKGKQVLKIIHNYRHTTSIFDDFVHYEKRQQEEPVPEENGKQERSSSSGSSSSNGGSKK